jgi:large-conductance mechanosensitive channel
MTSSLVLLFTNFLNRKTESILAVAAAMAIGASFKDLITSIVNNFLQPLIIKLILLTNISRLTKFANMDSLFSAKNNILNFSNVIVSILSFIFIVITVYIMVSLINGMSSIHNNNNTNNNTNNKNTDVQKPSL